MLNPIPERLVNFSVYTDSGKLLGIVDVTLPTITLKTEEVTGAGIGGTMNTPTLGQTDDLTGSMTFRTVNTNATSLMTPGWHVLEFRGAMQKSDIATGIITHDIVAVTMRAQLTGYNLGTFANATATGSSVDFVAASITVTVNGQPVLMIDKPNNIFAINGVDYMASVRSLIG